MSMNKYLSRTQQRLDELMDQFSLLERQVEVANEEGNHRLAFELSGRVFMTQVECLLEQWRDRYQQGTPVAQIYGDREEFADQIIEAGGNRVDRDLYVAIHAMTCVYFQNYLEELFNV